MLARLLSYEQNLADRAEWAEKRLQRFAKLYGWLEPKHYPWPNASNQHIPMLMTNSLRTQDTLHNAVLAARPVMSAIAVNKGDSAKGKQINQLQDYQFFVEQIGEEKISQLIDSFVNDGRFVFFMPWVKEKRPAREVHPVPAIPETVDPLPLYNQYLAEMFPPPAFVEIKKEGVFNVIIPSLEGNKAEDKAIGAQMAISDRTVQGHLAHIFAKLQASSRTEAVMRGVSLGLISQSTGSIPEE